MDRRTFLRALAAALAIPAVAKLSSVAAAPMQLEAQEDIRFVSTSSFDPSQEYGNAVDISGPYDDGLVDRVKVMLVENARSILPAGTPFVLMFSPEWASQSMGDPMNEREVFAWYYSPKPLSPERQARVLCKVIA